MPQPIYKLFLFKQTEAWYQLSQEAQAQLEAELNEALTEVGGKRIVICDARWAAEQWAVWGVEQFPDIEAVQKFSARLDELGWFRYLEGMTLLGRELPRPGSST